MAKKKIEDIENTEGLENTEDFVTLTVGEENLSVTQEAAADQQDTEEIVKPAKSNKAQTEIPDGVKVILKAYDNVPELYVNPKTGGVFDANTKLSTVGDAILFKNPFYHS